MHHPGRVYRAALSADASVAITTCDDGSARVWSMSGSYCTPHKLSFAAQHKNARACAISPEGQYAAVSFYKGLRRKLRDNDEPMSSFQSHIYLVQLRDKRQVFTRAEYGIADQIIMAQHASVVAIGLCGVRPARSLAKGHRIVLLSRDGQVLNVIKDCFPLNNHSCTAWHMPRSGHMLAVCSKDDNLQVHHAGPRSLWRSTPTILSSPTVRSFTICRFMHDHDLLAAAGTCVNTKQPSLLVFRISTASVLFHLPIQSISAAVHDIYPRIVTPNHYDPQLHSPFARILASVYPSSGVLVNLQLDASHSPDVSKTQPSTSSSTKARQSPKQDAPQFRLCREPSLVLNPRPATPSPPPSVIKSSESSTRTPLHSRFRNWVTDLDDKKSSQNASNTSIQWPNPSLAVNQPSTLLPNRVAEEESNLAAQRSEKLKPPCQSTPQSLSSPKKHAIQRPSSQAPQVTPQHSSNSKTAASMSPTSKQAPHVRPQEESKVDENVQNLKIRNTHVTTVRKPEQPIMLRLDSKASNTQRKNDCEPSAHTNGKSTAENENTLDETLIYNKNKPSAQTQGQLKQKAVEQDEPSPGVSDASGTDGGCKAKPPSQKHTVTQQSRGSIHGIKTGDQEKECDTPTKNVIDSHLSSAPRQLDKEGQPEKTTTRQEINGSKSPSPNRGEISKPTEDQRDRDVVISVMNSPDSNEWTPATRYAVREQNKLGNTASDVQNSTRCVSNLNKPKINISSPSLSTTPVRRCTDVNLISRTNICTSFATDKEGPKSPSNSGTAISDPVENAGNGKQNIDVQISSITTAQDMVKSCKDGDVAASSKASDGLENSKECNKHTGLNKDDPSSRENGYGKTEQVVIDRATLGTVDTFQNDTLNQENKRGEEDNPSCKQEVIMSGSCPTSSLVPLDTTKLKTEERTAVSLPIETLRRCKRVFVEARQRITTADRTTLTNQEAYTTMLCFAQKEGVYTDKKNIARVIYGTVGIKNSCTPEMFVDAFSQIYAHSRALRKQRWTGVFTAATCNEGESILVFHARDLMKAEHEGGRVRLDDKWTDDTMESVFERVSDGILVDLPSFLRGVEEILGR